MSRLRTALERIRSWSLGDKLFAVVLIAYGALVVAPWWSSALLPLMDYPMFLSFVRVFLDHDEPGSPFHGTYALGMPVSPLVLPITIVAGLSKLGSIELGGRLLWTLYALALPASALYLARATGQSRWNALLVFPLVFGKWVSSGFVGFVTGMPLVLFAYAAAVRHLNERHWKRGLVVSAVLTALVLWHAILLAQALIGVLLLWLCWRAPNVRQRLSALWPAALPIALAMVWVMSGAGQAPPPAGASRFVWEPLAKTFDAQIFFYALPMLFDASDVYFKVFVGVLLGSLLLGSRELGGKSPDSPTASWHVKNPVALIAFIGFVGYFAIPVHVLPAEVIGKRFAWWAALCLAIAWRWPAAPRRRALAIGVVLALAGAYLADVNRRFRQFHLETVGASRLIASIPKGALV